MTEKKSIADALNVQGYDESTGANLARAMGHVPVAGTVYQSGKSIAAHARQAAEADGLGELASAGAALVGDGAAFVGAAAGDMVTFAMDPIGWLVRHDRTGLRRTRRGLRADRRHRTGRVGGRCR
jgi:hypothetical protein